jgi:hypothetical protein
MARLDQLATTFRSKNAEPFMSTIDIYLPDREAFERVRRSEQLTEENVARVYNIPREAVYGVYFVDAVNAVKVSLYKYADGKFLQQGDPECADIFGAQQHIPLRDIEIP